MQALLRLAEPPWRLPGPGAILLVHAYSMYVYFYLFTRAGPRAARRALLEAAASLGAGRWRDRSGASRCRCSSPALTGAALLTFMTSLASFSAPYVFGGSFRVMTTQIVASKLNGDTGLAMVETVTLAADGPRRPLLCSRRAESAPATSPARCAASPRAGASSAGGRVAAAAAGWGLALLLLAAPRDAHARLAGAAQHLDDRGAAAGPSPSNYAALFSEPGAAAADRQLALDGDGGDGAARSSSASRPPTLLARRSRPLGAPRSRG